MTYNALNPSSNENIMAAVSHFFGFLVALFIWILQKDRSRFVRFQALQAMAFDVLISIIMLLITSCMVTLVITLMSLGIGNIALFGSQNNPTAESIRVMISLMQGVPFLATSIIFLSGTAFFYSSADCNHSNITRQRFSLPMAEFINRTSAEALTKITGNHTGTSKTQISHFIPHLSHT